MCPIDSFVGRANESGDDIALSSQEKEERELAYGNESGSVTDIFERPAVIDVEFVETEDENNDEVCTHYGCLSKGGCRYPEGLDRKNRQRSIGEFADDRCEGCYRNEGQGLWFGRCLTGRP